MTSVSQCALEAHLAIVGLDDGKAVPQRVCLISLERPDSVSTMDFTPARVGHGSTACVVDKTLYVVGIGHACNELWKWNATSDWTRCADMTSYRRHHFVAVIDSTIYALGGAPFAGGTLLTSIEAYNTEAADEWFAAGQLNNAVIDAACVSYNKSIYVFGGVDTNDKQVAHVQMYDAAQRQCTLLPDAMPQAHKEMRAVVWETCAVLLGGVACFVYNFEAPAGQKWLNRESFKTDARFFGLVSHKERLFIAGGGYRAPTAEVRSVWVRDVIEDKQGARWEHHATLPQPSLVYAFSPVPLYRALA